MGSRKAGGDRSADRWVRQIRSAITAGGSAKRAAGAQNYFQHAVVCRGWRTADLRRFAYGMQKQILAEDGPELLLRVADRLFTGKVNEETHVAVMLLQNRVRHLGDDEFALFEVWLGRVTNWSQHDGLVHYLIGPLVAADPRRAARIMKWTGSENRWKRRASAVGFIQPGRKGLCLAETRIVTGALLADSDDMVQKGLGWLLREWAKADPRQTVPFLMTIRARAPRLVLRTACETLPAATRARVLRRAKT
jgi:3-methyladenine DNA glycosylase AlkD